MTFIDDPYDDKTKAALKLLSFSEVVDKFGTCDFLTECTDVLNQMYIGTIDGDECNKGIKSLIKKHRDNIKDIMDYIIDPDLHKGARCWTYEWGNTIFPSDIAYEIQSVNMFGFGGSYDLFKFSDNIERIPAYIFEGITNFRLD